MQLKNITTTNFYILNDIINVQRENAQLPIMRNINNILSRVVIKLELENVRLIEVLALKIFGDVKYEGPLEETVESIRPFVDSLHLKAGSDSFYYSLEDCFLETKKMDTILDFEGMPIGFPRFNCTLTMTGGQILNLYGYDLFEITKIVAPTKSFEENVEMNIYNAVYSESYKYIMTRYTSGNDIGSGAWLNQNIYHKFKEPFVLASIIGDSGSCISFTDTTEEDLTANVLAAKEREGEKYKVEIICNTSLMVYYYILLFTTLKIEDCEDMSVALIDSAELQGLPHLPALDAAVKNYNAGYIKYECIKTADILTNLFMLPAARKISYSIVTDLESITHEEFSLNNLNHPIMDELVSVLDSANKIINTIS